MRSSRRRARSVGGAASILLSMLTGQADATSPEHDLDEITLRDGSRVRGRVVQRTHASSRSRQKVGVSGRFLGRRHRGGPWRWRAHQAPRASAERVAQAHGRRRDLRMETRAHGDRSAEDDVRSDRFLRDRRWRVPADVLGQTASDDVRGVGEVWATRRVHAFANARSRRTLFVVVASLRGWARSHVLHSRVPTGIPPANGEFVRMSRGRATRRCVRERGPATAHVPLNVGVHLALGSSHEPTAWRGVVRPLVVTVLHPGRAALE